MWIEVEEIELVVIIYIFDGFKMVVVEGKMCVYLFFFIVWEIEWMMDYFDVVSLYGIFVGVCYCVDLVILCGVEQMYYFVFVDLYVWFKVDYLVIDCGWQFLDFIVNVVVDFLVEVDVIGGNQYCEDNFQFDQQLQLVVFLMRFVIFVFGFFWYWFFIFIIIVIIFVVVVFFLDLVMGDFLFSWM